MRAKWNSSEVADISAHNITLLLAGEVPAVRIHNFCDPQEVARFRHCLHKISARSQTLDDVRRIGISQYQEGICGSKASYFEAASRFKQEQQSLYQQSFNPVKRMLLYLGAAGFQASVLEEPGWGEYYAGVGKERIGSTPLHIDFSAQDSAAWRVGEARAQLAWNLYLNSPDGGILRVWDRQWAPAHEVYRSGHSFVFSSAVVQDSLLVEIPVYEGDVVLINSRNYHAVTDTRYRLTFGSFISFFSERELGLWS